MDGTPCFQSFRAVLPKMCAGPAHAKIGVGLIANVAAAPRSHKSRNRGALPDLFIRSPTPCICSFSAWCTWPVLWAQHPCMTHRRHEHRSAGIGAAIAAILCSEPIGSPRVVALGSRLCGGRASSNTRIFWDSAILVPPLGHCLA